MDGPLVFDLFLKMCDVICNTFQFPVMFQMYQIAYARNSDTALNSNLSMGSMRIAGFYKNKRISLVKRTR